MTIYDWITAHPDDHLRIIRYEPSDDSTKEGTSTVMFDSTTGEGDLESLLLKEITNDWEEQEPGEDEPCELEYIPDEYWF